jgi:outer membrane lipoprotein-sorting protein
MARQTIAVALALFPLLRASPAAAPVPEGPAVLPRLGGRELITRMSRSHETVEGLCGSFRELHRLELMEQPILTHGRFWGDGVNRAVRKDIISGDTRAEPPGPAARLLKAAPDDRPPALALLPPDTLGAVAVATMKKAEIYYPAEKRLEIYHLDPKQMEHLFFLNLLLKPDQLLDGYDVSVEEAPIPPWPGRKPAAAAYYAVTLIPKTREMRRIVNAVTLYVHPKDFFPRAIQQRESTGDRTILVMEDLRINWPFPPGAFRIEPAPGTKRTELRVGAFIR